MQNCEKCGRPMKVTFANSGEGKLLLGKMFVCEHADCEAFMISQRPNTASSPTAPSAPAGEDDSEARCPAEHDG